MISPSEGKIQKEAERQTRLGGGVCGPGAGLPSPLPRNRVAASGRGGGAGGMQLPIWNTARPYRRPRRPRQPSGILEAVSDRPPLLLSPGQKLLSVPSLVFLQRVVLTRFPKGRETPRGLQGFALFLRGATGAQTLEARASLRLSPSAPPLPAPPVLAASPLLSPQTAKGLDGHWRDFGNTKGTKEGQKYHAKICWPKRSSRTCG